MEELIFKNKKSFFVVSFINGLIVADVKRIYLGEYEGKTGPLFLAHSQPLPGSRRVKRGIIVSSLKSYILSIKKNL